MMNLKKTTLTMIASVSMLLAAPAMDTNMNMQGQGMKMMQNNKYTNSPTRGQSMYGNKRMMKNKMSEKKMNSPFLIKHGLPHLSKMIMPYMNDPQFNLTADQKEKLTKVRVQTMGVVMETKPKVIALRKEIVNASTSGTKADDLKKKIAKLSLLQATATMAHLKCIEETKEILSKDQLLFLLVNKNKSMKHGKKNMMGNKCKGKRNMGQKSMMKNCKYRMNNQ